MRLLRITVKCVVAGVLFVVGTVMIPLPGPGIPLVLASVAVLATEFSWAADLQERIQTGVRRALDRLWRRSAAA